MAEQAEHKPLSAEHKPLSAAAGGFSAEIDGVSPSDWDRLIAGFEDGNLFQTAAFADGLRGEQRMSHLVLRRDGMPLAGARVAIMKLPGFPVGVAYVKHGPFWRRAGLPPDESVYRAVIAALIDEYAIRRGHMLSIAPRPHPQYQPLEERVLQEFGFGARRRPTRQITYFLVNTGLPEQALRASLSQTWRHQLKRGERSELDVQFRDAAEALPDFIALYHAMVARKQFIDREPLHVLPLLFQRLPPSCATIVTASHQGGIVAGAVVIIAGDVAYYLYGASADAALPLNAGFALHWRIAGWLRERGIGWYDLGDGFGGLRQFKQGFVGKSGAILTASELDYCSGRQAYAAGTATYAARNLLARLRAWQSWLRKKVPFLQPRFSDRP